MDRGDRRRRRPAASSASLPGLLDDLYYQNMFILSMVFAIGAVGLNIITGYAGYVSLGQGAFLGLGAYTVGIASTDIGGIPVVWLPVAGLLARAGRAARRRRHARPRPRVRDPHDRVPVPAPVPATNWDSLTNGTGGITLPLPPGASTTRTGPSTTRSWPSWPCPLLVSWWIRRSKFGMGLIAIREDEDKAATVGVSTPTYKILAFAASAVFVGMAGGGLRLLHQLHRPGRDVQHPPQRPDHPVAPARRAATSGGRCSARSSSSGSTRPATTSSAAGTPGC